MLSHLLRSQCLVANSRDHKGNSTEVTITAIENDVVTHESDDMALKLLDASSIPVTSRDDLIYNITPHTTV